MSAYVAKLIEDASAKPASVSSPYEELLELRKQIPGFVAGPKISRDELHERHRLR